MTAVLNRSAKDSPLDDRERFPAHLRSHMLEIVLNPDWDIPVRDLRRRRFTVIGMREGRDEFGTKRLTAEVSIEQLRRLVRELWSLLPPDERPVPQ